MSIMEIQKKFHEVKTGRFFDTLAAAKKACKYPHILRVWLQDGKTIGRRTLYAYGESCGTVKVADEEIADMLNDKQ